MCSNTLRITNLKAVKLLLSQEEKIHDVTLLSYCKHSAKSVVNFVVLGHRVSKHLKEGDLT